MTTFPERVRIEAEKHLWLSQFPEPGQHIIVSCLEAAEVGQSSHAHTVAGMAKILSQIEELVTQEFERQNNKFPSMSIDTMYQIRSLLLRGPK